MVFILGVNFPEQRLVKKSLQSFYGIGPQISQRLMARFHIHPTAKVSELGSKQVTDITAELSSMTIENDLKRRLRDNIRRLRDMGAYRGKRHAMNLPVRGQNTRTQVSTARKLNRIERWA
ncbi:mitochondrial 37S ribosomal protein SWS2 [Xylona heveae TC161]|uniref:Mitochondrial 37S ribosomal protein SWS2 n=1 Tax=Xylona heveae (strain CBS 132557 / TC161) TaxID=1328760 RepID=A0A165IDB5_XYLHT|nr:mitochondrial 37S ribosomal protein SWS2 [Xylona heveae TC161]KZF24735.1 mitochondrial 37S ribosomal protein SWS2 [Xylona heveae TC161]